MLLGSLRQAESHSTCQKSAQQRRTSGTLYKRKKFQTLDSFRCSAIYKNFKDCPVILGYMNVIHIVHELVTRLLLFCRTVSLPRLTPVGSVLFQALTMLTRTGSPGLCCQTLWLFLRLSDHAVSRCSVVHADQLKLSSVNP